MEVELPYQRSLGFLVDGEHLPRSRLELGVAFGIGIDGLHAFERWRVAVFSARWQLIRELLGQHLE